MIKNYTTNLIKSIQDVINSEKFEIETYKDYSFFTIINSAELIIKSVIEKSGRRDCTLIVNDSEITHVYIDKWRTCAAGKFIARDFKKDNRDFIGNTLYHKLTFINKNTKEKMYVLIRLLNEITDPYITINEKNEFIHNYGDICIDDKYFSIIKISDEDDWSLWDKYKSQDIRFEPAINNTTTGYIEEEHNDNANEIADESSSEPLF